MNRPAELSDTELPGVARVTWHRFLDIYEPLRPELYRYCRHLTRSPWVAEDLAQEALMRAFVTLAQMGEAPANPRLAAARGFEFVDRSSAWPPPRETARERSTEQHAV